MENIGNPLALFFDYKLPIFFCTGGLLEVQFAYFQMKIDDTLNFIYSAQPNLYTITYNVMLVDSYI